MDDGGAQPDDIHLSSFLADAAAAGGGGFILFLRERGVVIPRD